MKWSELAIGTECNSQSFCRSSCQRRSCFRVLHLSRK